MKGAVCEEWMEVTQVSCPCCRYSLGASWWTLSDNWEGTVLFWTLYCQVSILLHL